MVIYKDLSIQSLKYIFYLFSHSNIFCIFHREQMKFFLSMDFIWETENKTIYIKLTSKVQNVSENSKSYENFHISKI